MTAKCVDALSRLRSKDCMPPLALLLRHCLQNLVQYFKLAFMFFQFDFNIL